MLSNVSLIIDAVICCRLHGWVEEINFKSKYNIKFIIFLNLKKKSNIKLHKVWKVDLVCLTNFQLTSSDILNQGRCIFGYDSGVLGWKWKLTVMGQFLYFFENHDLKWSQSKYDRTNEKERDRETCFWKK